MDSQRQYIPRAAAPLPGMSQNTIQHTVAYPAALSRVPHTIQQLPGPPPGGPYNAVPAAWTGGWPPRQAYFPPPPPHPHPPQIPNLIYNNHAAVPPQTTTITVASQNPEPTVGPTYIPGPNSFGPGVGIPPLSESQPARQNPYADGAFFTPQTSQLMHPIAASSHAYPYPSPPMNSQKPSGVTPQGSDASHALAGQWPLDRVLKWLSQNGFSKEWQETFKVIEFQGQDFIGLSLSQNRRNMSKVHEFLLPQLAKECEKSGTKYDRGVELAELSRLRKLIRGNVDSYGESSNTQFSKHVDSASTEGGLENSPSFLRDLEDFVDDDSSDAQRSLAALPQFPVSKDMNTLPSYEESVGDLFEPHYKSGFSDSIFDPLEEKRRKLVPPSDSTASSRYNQMPASFGNAPEIQSNASTTVNWNFNLNPPTRERRYTFVTVDAWNYRLVDVTDVDSADKLRTQLCHSVGIKDIASTNIYLTRPGQSSHDDPLDDTSLVTYRRSKSDAHGSLKFYIHNTSVTPRPLPFILSPAPGSPWKRPTLGNRNASNDESRQEAERKRAAYVNSKQQDQAQLAGASFRKNSSFDDKRCESPLIPRRKPPSAPVESRTLMHVNSLRKSDERPKFQSDNVNSSINSSNSNNVEPSRGKSPEHSTSANQATAAWPQSADAEQGQKTADTDPSSAGNSAPFSREPVSQGEEDDDSDDSDEGLFAIPLPQNNTKSSRQSIVRDDIWASRPPVEGMIDRLDDFFPDIDLDQPVEQVHQMPSIDDSKHSVGSSGLNSDTGTHWSVASHDSSDTLGSNESTLKAGKMNSIAQRRFQQNNGLNRTKSIRQVAQGAMQVHRQNSMKATAINNNSNSGALLRRKSTKMFGGKIMQIRPQPGNRLSQLDPIPQHTVFHGSQSQRQPTFRIVRGQLIGKGTYGRVYIGMNADNGEILAVKQVEVNRKAAKNDRARIAEMVAALDQEIDTMQHLEHPNIVQYLGCERGEMSISIYLEYVAGGSIGSCLRKHGKFDESVVTFLATQVLGGLAYLHDQGILHRDLKADNILLDLDGTCKISDFGISKKTDNIYGNDVTNSMQGSVFWMAPEVVHSPGQGYSAKVDIWSLGCVVLEMFAGRRPWAKEEAIGAIFKLGSLNQAPPIPDDVSSTISPVAIAFMCDCFTVYVVIVQIKCMVQELMGSTVIPVNVRRQQLCLRIPSASSIHISTSATLNCIGKSRTFFNRSDYLIIAVKCLHNL